MPLHLDHRPETLADLHGNASLKASLESILDRPDRPRSFLFTGPSGCGKTTLARIVAKAIGCSDQDYQELDIGDARGIEDARKIKQNLHYAPMAGKVKVYCLDECFAPGTMIETEQGSLPIQEIRPGIKVKNLTGWGTVEQTFKNKVPLDKVTIIKVDSGIVTYCSSDHLYMTNNGWEKAKNLRNNFIFKKIGPIMDKGRDHYATEANANQVMSWVSTGIPDQRSKTPLLFTSMCPETPLQKRQGIISGNEILPSMWQGIHLYEAAIYQILQSVLCSQMEKRPARIYGQVQDQGICRAIQGQLNEMEERKSPGVSGIHFQNITKNEGQQPILQTRNHRKGQVYQGHSWFPPYLEGGAWRQWQTNRSSDFTIELPWLGNRGCHITRPETVGVSNLLQGGHRKPNLENGHRGGWGLPQLESHEVFRQEERREIERVRVDSVEIYKPGGNDLNFQDIVGDTERNQGFVHFYDLQVSGHPSYYANGQLVHNCQKATDFFQDAMLKALEQPPSHVAFILCTTNPEKLSVTVKRRCTQFEVKPLTDQEMDGFILSALARESIAEGYPPEIVQEIVKASNGSPGIAMNILDQVIDMQDGQQIMEVIRRTVVTEASVIDLCRALLARNWNGCRAQLIAMEKVDVEKVRYAVLTYMRKVLLGDRPDLSAYLVIRYFERAFYDSGLAGLVAASWAVANRQEPKDFQF